MHLRPSSIGLFLLPLLWACEPEEDVEPSALLDFDNDGFPQAEDCNDEDPSIHPDAVEL